MKKVFTISALVAASFGFAMNTNAEVITWDFSEYTEQVDLGPAEDGNPIVSFTSPVRHQSNPPSDRYRAWIETALIEECGVPAETAKRYLDRAIESCHAATGRNRFKNEQPVRRPRADRGFRFSAPVPRN
jgi:hypothetical protein